MILDEFGKLGVGRDDSHLIWGLVGEVPGVLVCPAEQEKPGA